MSRLVPHIIQNQRVEMASRQLEIVNPATGKISGRVNVANAAVVNQAVMAAHQAFATWSCTTPTERATILFKFKMLLEKNRDALAIWVTDEHGKTLEEAAGSIRRGLDVVDYTCNMANHLKTSFSQSVSTGVDVYSLRQPLGVCVGITPFNFPAMIPLWMFPMAIACGNTFVLKPSEKNPSCAVKLVELAMEAGVPEGVVNVVQGDKETVDALMTHDCVKAVSFVGSSGVAEYVYQTSMAAHKRVQAFGGAKNHALVMPDADLNRVARAIVPAAYGSVGERCMAISVVLAVGDQVADQLIDLMRPMIQQIKVGDGHQAGVTLGPLVTKAHFERVQAYVRLGQEEGAKLIIDGSVRMTPEVGQGYFMGPCLFDQVTPSMRIYQEEIFGPVLCVVRVPDMESALKLINEHEYGNGTAIFTSDGYTARYFVEKVQVGMVGVNVPIPVPVAYYSFGGWKRSIFSDMGMYGEEGIRFNTKLKTVTERWFAKGKDA